MLLSFSPFKPFLPSLSFDIGGFFYVKNQFFHLFISCFSYMLELHFNANVRIYVNDVSAHVKWHWFTMGVV